MKRSAMALVAAYLWLAVAVYASCIGRRNDLPVLAGTVFLAAALIIRSVEEKP